MAIENTVSGDFDLRSSIVKIVSECRLSDVRFDPANEYDRN